jgi:signal transduction histidine kinase
VNEPETGSAGLDSLRILILEDTPADAELAQQLLSDEGLDFTAVVADTKGSFEQQLVTFGPDVILADFSLPGFSGESAFKIAQQECPQAPFIFLSGVIGDDTAVELIRQGATDYVLKDRLARLPGVVRRAVAEADQQARLSRLEAHLQRSQRLEYFARLAAGVAHELNNQVGVMLSFTEFIREEAAGRAQQPSPGEGWDGIWRDAGRIEQAGQRVTGLIRQLLAAGGQQMVSPAVLNLNEVISGIDDLIRSTAGEHIDVRAFLAPRLWPVTADRGQVEQVLLNLTMNARDSMPGGGRLSIMTQNMTIAPDPALVLGLTPGAYVRLTARDNGAGMTPEILEHAFEPFFTTKPLVEGGGLGLAAVYGISTQAGGTARISSSPGDGTTVTIWLPAATGGTDRRQGNPHSNA